MILIFDLCIYLFKANAQTLADNAITVIPVALGIESDQNEILLTTTNKQNLIDAKDIKKPKELGDKIMEVVIKGKDMSLYKTP